MLNIKAIKSNVKLDRIVFIWEFDLFNTWQTCKVLVLYKFKTKTHKIDIK